MMGDMKKKAIDILEDYSNSYSQVDLETLTKFLEQIKSEAIKEFAERLKDMPSVMNCEYEWLHNDIDNLVAEMTEGRENDN